MDQGVGRRIRRGRLGKSLPPLRLSAILLLFEIPLPGLRKTGNLPPRGKGPVSFNTRGGSEGWA